MEKWEKWGGCRYSSALHHLSDKHKVLISIPCAYQKRKKSKKEKEKYIDSVNINHRDAMTGISSGIRHEANRLSITTGVYSDDCCIIDCYIYFSVQFD